MSRAFVCLFVMFGLAAACGDDDDAGGGNPDAGSMLIDAARAAEQADSLPSVPIIDASFMAPASDGGACSNALGVQCDGAEDCPSGQVCCGTFSQASFGYTSMVCAETCDAESQRVLCHPGDTCDNPDYVCRASQLLPFSFLSICAAPTTMVGEATGRSAVDQIVCGEGTCDAATEQCCLRSGIDFAAMRLSTLEPVCLPLSTDCTCDSEGETPAMDAGPAGDGDDAGSDG